MYIVYKIYLQNPNFNDSNNSVALVLEAGPEVMKLFMLNSTEHEIYHAYK